MSSGGGNQNSTSTTKVEYSPIEQSARDQIMQEGMGTYYQSKAAGGGAYPGARPVSAGSATQESWRQGIGAAGRIQDGTNAAQSANNFGLSDAMYADSNPYLQSAMDAATRPMVESFYEAGGPMQSIRNNAVANNSYGGSRQGIAEGIAQKGLINKVGDVRSAMASDAYYKGLDQMNNSIKNQAQLALMQQMPAQIFNQIGAQEEGFQQQNENYLAAQRDHAQNAQWAPLQNLSNIVYGGSNGTSTTTSSQPKPDNTMQTIGTVGSLALMAMMMSDRRLKRAIVKVGDDSRGFGWYFYQIAGMLMFGVMADELEKILPQAVALHPSGFKMVNYSKIGGVQ